MSKPSLRQTVLIRSVDRLLPPGEQAASAIMLFSRHHLFFPYAIGAGVVVFIAALLAGIPGLTNQIILAACGVAIAAMATTNHVVLAQTNLDLLLFRSSRVRQYAKKFLERIPDDTPIEMISGNVITSDWKIGTRIFTLTKRWEAAMRNLTAARDYP